MYLYNEREVEMKAWERYGGPEGFQRMLNEKAATGKKLYKPESYSIPRPGPSILLPCIRRLPPSDSQDIDIQTSTPVLREIKSKMKRRNEMWLWDALNEFLLDHDIPDTSRDGKDRTTLMQCACETLRGCYPKRPTSPLPLNSISIIHLLSEVPAGYDASGIDVHCDMFTQSTSIDWNKDYKARVYASLDKVFTEHGKDKLIAARWLVYDKVGIFPLSVWINI
ncbi:hypothetical protein BDN70DRAFT_929872 [Pholiota conissans]|uniref:Uncharacterized protein n=1 Tax=Pholiota conissans TaxID=109636 RepID=A0A9P5Z9F7_9AGAR|nr:hypothetical protein BDN70DRAFT_929872 [Pholiota conissans]